MSPTEDVPNPYSRLFSDWHNQSRLGPTDQGCPLDEDQEADGESKVGHSSQIAIPRTVPCIPTRQYPATFLACQNPSSVVGADICPTVLWTPSTPMPDKCGKAPPTCLWASTVLWASAFTIPGEHGKTPYMPLGINSMASTDVCHTRRRQRDLPHASDINSYNTSGVSLA